jgi:hypothetical protein
MSSAASVVEFVGVVKAYQALRPLRIAELRVAPGTIVSVAGIDAMAAEVLVNLMTAAVRPDAGEVRLFGTSTAAIDDYAAWLQMLDGLGLLTDRAVLLSQCTVAQNLALPLTLTVDPIQPAVLARVRALATEVGIGEDQLERFVHQAPPEIPSACGSAGRWHWGRDCSSPNTRQQRCHATRWRRWLATLPSLPSGAASGCSRSAPTATSSGHLAARR